MIVSNLIPNIYYKESRDFAYVGRLVEIILNYMKTGADAISARFDEVGSEGNTINLLVDTLGFDLKHEYLDRDLVYIASTLTELLRNKGTSAAVDLAVRLMLNSQQVRDLADFEFCTFDPNTHEVEIRIPDTLTDIILLEDLLEYILPAGIIYKFTRFHSAKPNQDTQIATESNLGDYQGRYHFNDEELAAIATYKHTVNIDPATGETAVENVEDVDIENQIGNFYLGVIHYHDCVDNDNDNICDICKRKMDDKE